MADRSHFAVRLTQPFGPDLHSSLWPSQEVRATAMVQPNTANKKKRPPKFQHLPKARGIAPTLVHPRKTLTSAITQQNNSNLHGSRHGKSSPSGRPKGAGRGSRWKHPQTCRNLTSQRRMLQASRHKNQIMGPKLSISTLEPTHRLSNPRNIRSKPRIHRR